MEKTDAKVRLFLELSNPHPIQILNYIPLKEYKDWTPEKMYDYPKSQYYYAFINDEELISRMKKLIKLNDPIEKIESVVENIKEQLNSSRIYIELNGKNRCQNTFISRIIKSAPNSNIELRTIKSI